MADRGSERAEMTIHGQCATACLEIIEKHLGSNGWMTMAIDFKDTSHGISGGDHPGEYTMFLQIERQ